MKRFEQDQPHLGREKEMQAEIRAPTQSTKEESEWKMRSALKAKTDAKREETNAQWPRSKGRARKRNKRDNAGCCEKAGEKKVRKSHEEFQNTDRDGLANGPRSASEREKKFREHPARPTTRKSETQI